MSPVRLGDRGEPEHVAQDVCLGLCYEPVLIYLYILETLSVISETFPRNNIAKILSKSISGYSRPGNLASSISLRRHRQYYYPSISLLSRSFTTTTLVKMPVYNVTLKEGASEDELKKAKEQSTKEGGEIQHEFTLIKGFTVKFPDDKVNVLTTNEHVHVELDGEMKTQ